MSGCNVTEMVKRRVLQNMIQRAIVVVTLCLACPMAISAPDAGVAQDVRIQPDSEASFAGWPVIGTLDELVSNYEMRAHGLLPILVPDPGYMQAFDGSRMVVDLDGGGFPNSFVNRLSEKGIEDRGVMTYPIILRLHQNHDFILEAYDGTQLTRIKRPDDYDRFWYVRSVLAGQAVTRSAFQAMSAIHDPTRIVGWYTLFTPEGAQVLSEIEAVERALLLAATPLSLPSPMMMMGAGGSYSDDLHFAAIEAGVPSSNDVQLTIGYPASMYGVPLDIVGCADLLDWDWSVLASTNCATGADSFDYVVSPASTNRQFFACYRTDAAGDEDGDGVPSGTEKFIDNSDPDNPHDPPNITGTVTYSGKATGSIQVEAYIFRGAYYGRITLTSPGDYVFPKLVQTNYYLRAYIDLNGDAAEQDHEPHGAGRYSSTVTGQVTNVNIALEDVDSDRDGLPDWWEYAEFGDFSETGTGDKDKDALSNFAEYNRDTDPNDSDTDDDLMGDGTEVARGENPKLPPSGYSQYMTLPFTEGFESPMQLDGLDGQNRWTTESTNQVLVSIGDPYSGNASLMLAGGTATPTAQHLVGASGVPYVWLDFHSKVDRKQISAYRDHPDISELPDTTATAFMLNCDGHIFAYDGTLSNWKQATSIPLSDDVYHRYTVKQDYVQKTWDLYVDSILVEQGIGFRDPDTTELSLFSMGGIRDGDSYCDNINITTTKPVEIP